MSRIEQIPDEKLGWVLRSIKRMLRKKLGLERDQQYSSLNLQAHNKKVMFAGMAYMATLERWNRLPSRLKRLVHVRVAMRVGCPF